MTKNIIVLDENDNEIGKTYPKRVKGLIKSGRAEPVQDGVIRLKAAPFPQKERTQIDMETEKQEILNKIDTALRNSEAALSAALSTLEKADTAEKAAAAAEMFRAQQTALTAALKLYNSVLLADTPIANAIEKAADSGSLETLNRTLESCGGIFENPQSEAPQEVGKDKEE